MNKKIAIVYDWMDKWGGVERLLTVLHEIFPEAPFYTSHVNDNLSWIKNIRVLPSFIQKLPKWIRSNRLLSAFLYPYAFESFNLSEYDIVISISSSYAKAVVTKPHTKHINFMLAPTRFLWTHEKEYINPLIQNILKPYFESLKNWDKIVSQRPDIIISISNFVKNQCKKYYNCDSEVLYPPFDLDYWSDIKKRNKKSNFTNLISTFQNKPYYLIVSRLEPYKRIDLPITYFNQNPEKNLIIVGKGSQKKKLKKMASTMINFIDCCSDEDLAFLYSHANALIMPQAEDFGYVSLESQFFGCPIISYKNSGVAETISNNKTGLLFSNQTIKSLSDILEKYQSLSYTMKNYTKSLDLNYFSKFSKKHFVQRINQIIYS